MENLPYELFLTIIGKDVEVYRALLAIPCFARMLTIGKILDCMVNFGYDVRVKQWYIVSHFNAIKNIAE